MSNLMTNGDFFRVVSGAISTSQAHTELLHILKLAQGLQKAVDRYQDEFGCDIATEMMHKLEEQLPVELNDYKGEIRDELEDWDGNTFNDIRGFSWSLDSFVSLMEGQLYIDSTDTSSETDTDTDLDDSTDEPTALLIEVS